MNNNTIWTAFKEYGNHIRLNHNNPDLFDLWHTQLEALETQIMVVPGTKQQQIDSKNIWSDGDETWKHVRWPYKANTSSPEWNDYPITFDLSKHLQAIGSTGWNWKTKESYWVGFDFDSIIGHANGIGVTENDLVKIVEKSPPYCTVFKSTRGNGRHLYIFFNPLDAPKTNTHTEHAALARAMLSKMSFDTGFNFQIHMDVCGQILWLYHKNSTPEGYKLLKPSSGPILISKDVPPNWKDHLDVTTGNRTKVKVQGYTSNGLTKGDELDDMTKESLKIELDDVHKAIINDLEQSGYSVCWVHDHHLLQTHTVALKNVHRKWAENGHPMKGPFETNAPGSDPGKPNCFLRPVVNGGWNVYRFGEGTKEHPLWSDQGKWTFLPYNQIPTLRLACIGAGGKDHLDKNKFMFDNVSSLNLALSYIGADYQVPEELIRTFYLSNKGAENRLVIETEAKSRDEEDFVTEFKTWIRKGKFFIKVLNEKITNERDDPDLFVTIDNKLRLVKEVDVTDTGSMGGSASTWFFKDATGKWVIHTEANISKILKGVYGLNNNLLTQYFGLAANNAWTHVNIPFREEYPGGREWNYKAPQLIYSPRALDNDEAPNHPHWDLIFEHLGQELNEYIPQYPWCSDWGIVTGGDYLKAWVSVMLREPFEKLPYLFFYGEQSTGKSVFHEAIDLLISNGVVKADRALTNQNDFNGELANAVLGVVDEVDVSRAGLNAYNKLKEWTTGLNISIHAKFKPVIQMRSSLHLVQMSNTLSSLPIFGDDKRVTALYVDQIENEIPKGTLIDHLRDEAPDIMHTFMKMPFPSAATGRLRLPYINTETKLTAAANNRDALEEFINAHCFEISGTFILLQEFYDKFIEKVDAFEKSRFTKNIVRKKLSERFPVGRFNNNQVAIGNLSFEELKESSNFIVRNGKLIKEEREIIYEKFGK
jgi:hypothetical protein